MKEWRKKKRDQRIKKEGIKKCLYCGKELDKNLKKYFQMKYCTKNCRSKKWSEDNPQKVKMANGKHYKKNISYYKEYRQRPEVKAYHRKYQQRSEVIAKKKEYNQRPEVKAKRKAYNQSLERKASQKVYEQSPKGKVARKAYEQSSERKVWRKSYDKSPKRKAYEQSPKRKAFKRTYQKEYNQRPEVKANRKEYSQRLDIKVKRNKNHKQRIRIDKNYRIQRRIRNRFNKAMEHYSKTGKIRSLKEYGVDFKAIIKHLGPKPSDGNIYEIDHIIPLSKFDHNDEDQIRKAWVPNNHQWLTKEINMWKGSRLIKPLTDEEKERLHKKLVKKK